MSASILGNTYAHMFGALLLTGLSAENSVVDRIPFGQLLSGIVSLVVLFFMVGMKVGIPKYAMFVAFTLLLGQMLTGLVDRLESKGVIREVIANVAFVFIGMTIVAFIDKQNMIGFGPYLFAGLIGLFLGRLILLGVGFFKDSEELKPYNRALTYFAIVLFSVYVAYDTQVLKATRSRDYINNSLGLFLDILNLFTSFGSLQE